MTVVAEFAAPAKLNLFLHVVGRREDGYHLLQSAFTLIDRCDTVRVRLREDGIVRRTNEVPGVPEAADLAVRAARALRQASGTRRGCDLEIEKRIPMGGGLGGGSSDAATVLLALNRLWDCGLPAAELARLGLALGADVPFFLFGRPAWVEGVGERLDALEVPPRWYVVLVPPVHVPTAEVFRAAELTRDSEPLKMEDFSAYPSARFRNDLEPVVLKRYPEVERHLRWLRGMNGQARMTGSGGCVFAGFDDREAAHAVLDARPPGMQGFIAQGLPRHPLREQ